MGTDTDTRHDTWIDDKPAVGVAQGPPELLCAKHDWGSFYTHEQPRCPFCAREQRRMSWKPIAAACVGFFVMLAADVTQAASPVSSCGVTQYTLTADDDTYQGSTAYWAYNNPWGKGALVNGRDYTQSIVAYPASFPDATYIKWSWPTAIQTVQPYGYPEVIYGNQHGNVYPSPNGVKPTPMSVGREMGAEPYSGNGSLTINRLSYVWN